MPAWETGTSGKTLRSLGATSSYNVEHLQDDFEDLHGEGRGSWIYGSGSSQNLELEIKFGGLGLKRINS